MKRLLLLAASLTFIMAGCGSYGGGYGAPRTASPETPATVAGEIAITASYPKFQPPKIELTKDKATRLRLTSADVPHTLTVDELGINISVSARQTVSQDITASKAGTFTFYCAVPGHRQAGMQGTVEVK